MIVTAHPPSASSLSARCDPMKPAPPVTSIFFDVIVSVKKPLASIVTFEHAFEKAFVCEGLGIVLRLELEHYR